MPDPDVRWQQRLHHCQRALLQLAAGVRLAAERTLSPLEEQGLIKAFEYTYELSWNVLKDFLESQGAGPLYGSRDTIRSAFRAGLLEDGEGWMEMVESRNLTAHSYDEATAARIVADVRTRYVALITTMVDAMSAREATSP